MIKNYPKPWTYCDAWDNQSQFLTWLRGQLRQVWSDYPARVEFKENKCIPVTEEMRDKYGLHRQTKKAAQCVFCNGWFAKSKLEVDHIVQVGSMRSMDEVEQFIMGLLCSPQNMQLTCKACHKVKSYSEKMGITFEEAKVEKGVIAWMKMHTTEEQKQILALAGFEDDEINNAENRRIAARELLKRPDA